MAIIVRRTAKLNQCDNIVSRSSFGPPAALMALSDIPLDSGILGVILRLSRAARNEIGPQPLSFAPKSLGLSASRGLQPVALRSRHTSHRAGCEGDAARGWPHRMQDQSRYPDRGGCDRQPAHRGAASTSIFNNR